MSLRSQPQKGTRGACPGATLSTRRARRHGQGSLYPFGIVRDVSPQPADRQRPGSDTKTTTEAWEYWSLGSATWFTCQLHNEVVLRLPSFALEKAGVFVVFQVHVECFHATYLVV